MADFFTEQTLMGSFEEKQRFVRSFTLFDDTFFAKVMEDKDSCEEVLRVLTGIEDLVVKEVKTQFSIRNLESHSVILDALAEDSNHRVFNIEVQTTDRDDHQKRVRYYQSNIDVFYLDKGKKYEDLPEVYLIYLTKFDVFKKGKVKYEVARVIVGTDITVENGVHEVYVNAANKENTMVSELMEFFSGTEPSNENFPRLSRRIRHFKDEREGVEHMCEAVERYGNECMTKGMAMGREKGRAEGRMEEKLAMVRQAYRSGVPVKTIAQFAGLSEKEIQRILEGSQS